jgi:hypothetical protein
VPDMESLPAGYAEAYVLTQPWAKIVVVVGSQVGEIKLSTKLVQAPTVPVVGVRL